jgi:hypothetical protein
MSSRNGGELALEKISKGLGSFLIKGWFTARAVGIGDAEDEKSM